MTDMGGDRINKSEQADFLRRMQELVAHASQNRNVVTPQELEEKFADLELTPEQQLAVRAYLAGSGIGVGEQVPLEERITREEHNYLEDYCRMLDSIDTLSEGEKDAVRLSAMAGEKSAQEELITINLRNVTEIAKLYAGQGVLMEDLIGAGNEALTIGVSLLAPLEHPSEVDGFLAERVMSAMEDLIRYDLDLKASDRAIEERVNLVAGKAAAMAEETGRPVTVSELAGETELTQDEIREIMRLSGSAIKDIAGD